MMRNDDDDDGQTIEELKYQCTLVEAIMVGCQRHAIRNCSLLARKAGKWKV